MPVITDGLRRPTFALYYRIVLDKKGYSRGTGLPIASAGQWPRAYTGRGIAETPEDIGMKIFNGLYKRFADSKDDDWLYHLLFQQIAFLGREVEGKLREPRPDEAFNILPSNDVVDNPCPQVCLVVGDMSQAYIPITHLLLRGAFPLHVVCPCRQHFCIVVEGGPDELYDGRVWWFSLEGIRYCDTGDNS